MGQEHFLLSLNWCYINVYLHYNYPALTKRIYLVKELYENLNVLFLGAWCCTSGCSDHVYCVFIICCITLRLILPGYDAILLLLRFSTDALAFSVVCWPWLAWLVAGLGFNWLIAALVGFIVVWPWLAWWFTGLCIFFTRLSEVGISVCLVKLIMIIINNDDTQETRYTVLHHNSYIKQLRYGSNT